MKIKNELKVRFLLINKKPFKIVLVDKGKMVTVNCEVSYKNGNVWL